MEGDAGTSRLNPTDDVIVDEDLNESQVESQDDESDESQVESTAQAHADSDRRPSRLGRRGFVLMFLVLFLLAGGIGAAGFLALRADDQSLLAARQETEAVAAAKDCVSATHAPDTAAMAASLQKIIECATGDFGAYATMMAPMMVEAYQAANVKLEVTEMRAAVERRNDDGSVDVLVAFRFRVPSNPDTQNQEVGLRLRAQMAPDNGRYKIARLDQVTT